MIRQPSPLSEIYAWHAANVGHRYSELSDEAPECGWFALTMVKGGPFVPARIWLDQEIDPETGELMRPENLCAEINGAPAPVERVWRGGDVITEAHWHQLTERHRTDKAMQATHVALDLSKKATRPTRRLIDA